MNKISHAMERRTFDYLLGKIMAKAKSEEISDLTASMIRLMKRIMKDSWSDESYQVFQNIADNPDSKWGRYVDRLLRDNDNDMIRRFLVNAAYEGGFRGYKTSEKLREKYQCNIPWIILMDPTSACNLHCIGCWAAEYGHKQNLSFDTMDRIISEGRQLGVHAYLYTGGEPLVRKKDLIRLCEKYPDCAFHGFTNATLIDDQFCQDLLRVKNFMVSVSLEGDRKATDQRRGKGTYDKVIKAMDLMHSYRIPYGVSICYTSQNYRSVTSDEFVDMIIDKGAVFAWYFHYMPVGMNASTDLLLTPEQRVYVKDRIREIRGLDTGKEIFAIDFQNDGEFAQGCVAGGRRYCHINAAGDVEPCVFIHYSGANINEKSLLDCLRQPLFLEYYKNQPFNNNHLRPCPMLENPQILKELVERSQAKSTDLEACEPAEHLCDKCRDYADKWQPVADRIWQQRNRDNA